MDIEWVACVEPTQRVSDQAVRVARSDTEDMKIDIIRHTGH